MNYNKHSKIIKKIFFELRKSLLTSSRSGGGAVFVKFENETNDVELIKEEVHLQRKSSFDNPTYEAVQENLTQSQVMFQYLQRYRFSSF